MTGTAPDTAADFSFGDDDGEWEDWLASEFDSGAYDNGRSPVGSTGEILKLVRGKVGPKGISQKDMAERLGIPLSTYKSYETHQTAKVPAEVLRRIVSTTDVDAEFILTGRTQYSDPTPILDDGFQLARLLAQRVDEGRYRLTFGEIMDITVRVISLRADRRYRTEDPSVEYTEADIAEALSDHAYGRWRFQDLADRDEER